MFLEGAERVVGNRQARHAHQARIPVEVGFVVEVDPALVDQGVGIVDGETVPFVLVSIGDHDLVGRGPRPVRGVGPGDGDRAVIAAGRRVDLEGLVVEVPSPKSSR